MMEDDKSSLTLNGMTGKNFLFILNAIGIISVCIYLTIHFYDVLYPTKLGGTSSLCDISNLFNCDAATYSSFSNVAGVPISFFGIIVGIFFLYSSLMPSEAMERTASALSKYNFIGCLFLLIFSVGVLGSLCPFCTLYYLLSGIAFFLLWKNGLNSWRPDGKISSTWMLLLLLGSFFMYKTTKNKEEMNQKMSSSVVEQYRSLPNLGEPDEESPYKIHMATSSWNEAPIRMVIFSDFECPFCKVVAEQVPQIIRKYSRYINVQYMFYPLDSKCNSNMKASFHRHACDAAMLAACDEKKFLEVHDEIFLNQEKLKSGILQDIAKKFDLKDCFEREDLKNKIISTINQGTKYNLKSTPTMIVNGKKIEGTIPNSQFFAVFEDILKNHHK